MTKEYTVRDAIALAHILRDFPYGGTSNGAPRLRAPTIPEALSIIEDALKRHPFNWITGQTARDLLNEALARKL